MSKSAEPAHSNDRDCAYDEYEAPDLGETFKGYDGKDYYKFIPEGRWEQLVATIRGCSGYSKHSK